MEVNMFLRETNEAADGLCIRACAYTTPDDARAALHAQYMLMIDVTHPHRVLTSGPPQLPDDAANAADPTSRLPEPHASLWSAPMPRCAT